MSTDGSNFYEFAKNSELKDSDTYKKYELLDKNACGNSDESFECKSSETSSGSIDKSIAAKIKRNIKYLKGIGNGKEYRSTCLYYKYWMYENIKNTINSKKHIKSDWTIIDEFLNFHNEHMKNGNSKVECEYHFYYKNLPELTYFIEQKHLHDYFVNYKNIIKVTTCQSIAYEKYRKYLQSISDLYILHKKECCDEYGMNDCPNYFNCYEGYNPNNILSALKQNGNCDNLTKLNEAINKQSSSNDSDSKNSIVTTVRCNKVHPKDDKSLVFYLCEFPKNVETDKVKLEASSYGEKKIHNKHKSPSSKKSKNPVVSKEPSIKVIKNGSNCSSSEKFDEKSKTCTNIEEKTGAQSTPDQRDSVMIPSRDNSHTRNVSNNGNALGTEESVVHCVNPNSKMCLTLKNLYQSKNHAVKTHSDERLSEVYGDWKNRWETSPDELDNISHEALDNISLDSSGTLVDISDMLTSSIFRIIICSVLLFGALYLFFHFYKYTSIGYWLRSKMTRKKYTQESVSRKLQNRQQMHDPPYNNINHERKRINIVYQQS